MTMTDLIRAGAPRSDMAARIADEYARLARLANRIYRAGQKAGPK